MAVSLALHLAVLSVPNGSLVRTISTQHEEALLVSLLPPPSQPTTETDIEPIVLNAEPAVLADTRREEMAQQPRPAENQPPAVASTPNLGLDLPELRYYSVPELDIRPYPVNQIKLDDSLPNSVAINGEALLEVLIERDGQINAVNVVRSNLPPPYEAQAVTAFKQARYSLAMRQGMQVRSKIYIEIRYVDGVLNNLPEREVDLTKRQTENSTWGYIPRPQRPAKPSNPPK